MTSPKTPSKIVIVCALKEEFAAVEAGLGKDCRERFELIRAGVGPVAAGRVAKELAARGTPPKLIVSTGFCGGLWDQLKVGDTLASHEIVDADSETHYGSDWTVERAQMFEDIHNTSRNGITIYGGKTVCTRDAVFSPAQKRALGLRFGAAAVDMESYALVQNSDAARTRVIVLRAVSDAVNDELPAEVGEFLNEAGNVRIGKIAHFILEKSGNIKRLMELKKRSDIAAKALTEAWRAIRDVNFDA